MAGCAQAGPQRARRLMLLIPIHSLKPGMTLAQPILHPLSEKCVLLAPETVLKAFYIKRLQELDVTHAWVAFPGFEDVGRGVNPRASESHMRMYDVLSKSVNDLEKRVEVRIHLAHYTRAVRHMLSDIVTDNDHQVLTHQLASCQTSLAGHSANCCYLALLVGAHMTGYLRNERATLPAHVAENTNQLGVGALLHDIGKLQMPDDMQDKCILDPEAGWREYQYHVHTGYEQARDGVSVLAANVILNHHQRFDGTGFPARKSRDRTQPAKPLSDRQIHIFARIVSVVDVFDHLLRPNGQVVPTIRAIRALGSRHFAGWFDPVVVETLLRLVPPFQVGSVVTLSTGQNAAVVTNYPDAPCRPKVRVIQGSVAENNVQATDRQLDLRMSRDTGIVAVDGMDVRKYIYTGELEPV